MHQHNPNQGHGPAINRISDLMEHSNRYAFDGVSKLASDAGISQKSLWRFINNEVQPTYFTIIGVVEALEREFQRRFDPREIIAERGQFLTRNTCDLCGCRGCRPEVATDEYGDLQKSFEGVKPGEWVTSRYPNGYEAETGGLRGN